MTETVPADIAAAIIKLVYAVHPDGAVARRAATPTPVCLVATAVAELNVVILAHLRGYAEMKAALELQTSGAA